MLDLIVKQAAENLGIKEITGPIHNDIIVGWFAELGCGWFDADEVAWCAIAMNIVLKRQALPFFKAEKAPRAAEFLNYGTEVEFEDALPGDILVFKREGGFHVSVFTGWGFRGDTVFSMGGNQKNMFCISKYAVTNLLAIRRAPSVTSQSLTIPNYPLVGKPAVSQLQAILAFYGFYKKLQDGDYGPGTIEAVKAFQTKHGLPVTGQYSEAMKSKIFSLLNA